MERLSNPSKMPCLGWSISAWACIIGSILAQVGGTICAICYARKGRYIMECVVKAMERRLSEYRADPDAWVDLMVGSLAQRRVKNRNKSTSQNGGEYCGEYFRWFDSGDLQSVAHLGYIVEVCKRTPHLEHWLPTKQKDFVTEYVRAGREIPRNLIVRLSASKVGQSGPHSLARKLTSTLRDNGYRGTVKTSGAHLPTLNPAPGHTACPAGRTGAHGRVYSEAYLARDRRLAKQEGRKPIDTGYCGTCRRCWSHHHASLDPSYPAH